MQQLQDIDNLIASIKDDLTSGAAEIALRAITIFQLLLERTDNLTVDQLKAKLTETVQTLIQSQPAMAPLYHLGNSVLHSMANCKTINELKHATMTSLDNIEKQLCSSAAAIADYAFELIAPGNLVFAYSFSSTVVSALLNARSKGKFFRVVCTESRPSMEGRKLATVLAGGGIEVINTFDTALGLVLSECSVAFMGCDVVGSPGVVNKVGSWTLAIACRELGIPLYALTGTEKFATDERLFEFEKHERPDQEVWSEIPKGVRVLNHQFELVPFSLISGLVTEQGILKDSDITKFISKKEIHPALAIHQ